MFWLLNGYKHCYAVTKSICHTIWAVFTKSLYVGLVTLDSRCRVVINGSALWHIVSQNDTFPVPKDCHILFTDLSVIFSTLECSSFFTQCVLTWLVECSSAPTSHPQWLPDPVWSHCACSRVRNLSECVVPSGNWVFVTATHHEWLCVWLTIHILQAAYTQQFCWV